MGIMQDTRVIMQALRLQSASLSILTNHPVRIQLHSFASRVQTFTPTATKSHFVHLSRAQPSYSLAFSLHSAAPSLPWSMSHLPSSHASEWNPFQYHPLMASTHANDVKPTSNSVSHCYHASDGSVVPPHRPHADRATFNRCTATAHATTSSVQLRWHSHFTSADTSRVSPSAPSVTNSEPLSTVHPRHPPTVSSLYSALVSSDVITQSEEQLEVVGRLDGLLHELNGYDAAMRVHQVALQDWLRQHAAVMAVIKREEQERAERRRRRHAGWHVWLRRAGEGVMAPLQALQEAWSSYLQPSSPHGQALYQLQRQRQQLQAAGRAGQRRRERGAGGVEPGAGWEVRRMAREREAGKRLPPRPLPPAAPKGLYIYGNVGCGKTMLMDLLHQAAREGSVVGRRHRVHFNTAMLELHQRMHHHFKRAKGDEADEAAGQQGSSADIQRCSTRAQAKEHHTDAGDHGGRESSRGWDGAAALQPAHGSVCVAVTDHVQRTPPGPVPVRSVAAAAMVDEAAPLQAGVSRERGVDMQSHGVVARHSREEARFLHCSPLVQSMPQPVDRQAAPNTATAEAASGAAAPAGMSKMMFGQIIDEEEIAERGAHVAILDLVADDLLRSWGAMEEGGGAVQQEDKWRVSETGRDGGGADGACLLCFDEVQVLDVFTAIALSHVLRRLLQAGVVVVATSNKSLHDLNKDGMQKELFDLFVSATEASCHLHCLTTPHDFRRLAAPHLPPIELPPRHPASVHGQTQQQQQQRENQEPQRYLWPNPSVAASAAFELLWESAVSDEIRRLSHSGAGSADKQAGSQQQHKGGVEVAVHSVHVPVLFGRSLPVPQCLGGIARFAFQDLCAHALGPADYVALASTFHTVFLSDIPIMSRTVHDQARRFLTLIDELYNHHCLLVCTAAAPPDRLFRGRRGARKEEERTGEAHQDPDSWDLEGEGDDDEDAFPIDFEGLQSETAVEGARSRTDVTVAGDVAVLGSSRLPLMQLSGREEEFAFRRAISRLLEMQSAGYAVKHRSYWGKQA